MTVYSLPEATQKQFQRIAKQQTQDEGESDITFITRALEKCDKPEPVKSKVLKVTRRRK